MLTKSSRGVKDLVIRRSSTWWLHASRSWRECSGYATPTGFVGFVHKTAAGEFTGFGPQKPRREFGVACDIIRQLASRQSYLIKSLWMSDAWIST